MIVHGRITATEIEVTLNGYADWWPDYVFEKDYSLTPLQEVEKFIYLHKHLPGVPSASEIQQKGLNVAEMDAALLKKIEELTLYIIELNKKIEELQQKIKVLNSK